MPISYTVKTSSAKIHSSWKWQHERRHVAVLKVDTDLLPPNGPTMISTRARGVLQIMAEWRECYVGSTSRCQYGHAIREAEILIADLTHR